MTEFEYVERHDCPALGKDARLIKAYMSDSSGEYILYQQYKCPFCSLTRGEKEFSKGVTQNADGSYSVNVDIAEKLHNV